MIGCDDVQHLYDISPWSVIVLWEVKSGRTNSLVVSIITHRVSVYAFSALYDCYSDDVLQF